ncbi:MAG: hypothetical protein ACT4N2_04000 [Hyphomicrobium sp.]
MKSATPDRRKLMQGQIVRFDEQLGQGVIATNQGEKFRFQTAEVRNPNGKLVGLDVDFLVESRRPKDIILLHGSPWLVFAS